MHDILIHSKRVDPERSDILETKPLGCAVLRIVDRQSKPYPTNRNGYTNDVRKPTGVGLTLGATPQVHPKIGTPASGGLTSNRAFTAKQRRHAALHTFSRVYPIHVCAAAMSISNA